jgi:hypothetical protein
MKHLSETELVDLVEGRLAPDRQAHAHACESCRSRAAGLRRVLETVSTVSVPEPSPLFWQHLSARIMDGVSSESTRDGSWNRWLGVRAQTWALVASLVVITGLALLSTQWTPSPTEPSTAREPSEPLTSDAEGAVDPMFDASDDLNADEGWAIVRTVADDVDWSEAAAAQEPGLLPRPGWADRAALSLTAPEISELTRLLEIELKRVKGA